VREEGGGKVVIYPACTRRSSQHSIVISTDNLHIPHHPVRAARMAKFSVLIESQGSNRRTSGLIGELYTFLTVNF
jgi:hypothetical protein